MTAVAPPLTSTSRLSWSSNGADGFGIMSASDDRMFAPNRKTVQRSNSSSSIASTNSNDSTTSTISASSVQTNGTSVGTSEAGSWAARKKPTRGLWPPGKAEPATGLTAARPQAVSATNATSTASAAISALTGPMLPSQQQLVNGVGQQNGVSRNMSQPEAPAILHLLPMNGTFERKTITIPFYPDVLRIGRQTNQKTIPTPLNGYFDSKVLSRQHAEVWADRQGRIFIRDVKSSNGTFVNGVRLSQENKESEPRELREQDLLELGIDIVSEDQKTVVHHKVAAKVEHAGVYGQGNDALNFGDLDPNTNGALMVGPHPMKRSGVQGSINVRGSSVNQGMNQGGVNLGPMNPQPIRTWLYPVTPENIVKKMTAETRYAMQQSQNLARARQAIEAILGNKLESFKERDLKAGSERSRPSPIKAKGDLKAHFMEPPAPPPQAPLPEKPDVARALADPVIMPLLRRNDTARAPSANSSPTRNDHSGDILRLCEELKIAKGELSSQSARMMNLEKELAQERSARESAEERAQRLERRDSPRGSTPPSIVTEAEQDSSFTKSAPDLQLQLTRLQISMDDMKQQMEAYRLRANMAESERDEAQQSLAQMVEQKRKDNAELASVGSPSKPIKADRRNTPKVDGKSAELNGHAVSPSPASPTSETLREHAGLEEGQPITQEQAKIITRLLTQEVLGTATQSIDGNLTYYGRPYGSAAAVVILGFLVMTYVNGWPRVER